jgi:hypothetical protein
VLTTELTFKARLLIEGQSPRPLRGDMDQVSSANLGSVRGPGLVL